MVPLSLIQVLKQLGNLWKNIKLKTMDINTYIMDKPESALKPRSSLYPHSTIDYKNSLLVPNMLLMKLIKMYYIDNHYQIVRRWEVQDQEKWRVGHFILQEHQLSCKKSSLNTLIHIILRPAKTAECSRNSIQIQTIVYINALNARIMPKL